MSVSNMSSYSSCKPCIPTTDLISYGKCGECYRILHFIPRYLKMLICIDIFLVLLNIFLIYAEIEIIIRNDTTYVHHTLPLWYIIIDSFITISLLCEISFIIIGLRNCACHELRLKNFLDICMISFSLIACMTYVVNVEEEKKQHGNSDNIFAHAVNIVLIIRVLGFYQQHFCVH